MDQTVSLFAQIVQRFKDMGDNTFAQVVAIGGNDFPAGATPVNAASGNVAAAVAAATLPAVAGKTNYVTGFEITAGGATAAALVAATLAGILGGTATYIFAAPAGATVGAAPLIVTFRKPLPASAVNTAITISLPSLGAGNTNASVNIHGFLL